MITDVKGRIVYVNKAFEYLSGYSFDEVYQKNPNFLKSDLLPESNFKDLWSTILSGDSWEGEFHNIQKNGDYYWTESKLSSVTNIDGEIIYFIAIQNDITDRKERLEDSNKLAITDSLTGVFNRNVLNRENSTHFIKRFDTDLYCVILADIDYFKKINDTYGHDTGDKVLIEVARRIQENIREDDILIRYGGEEFLIILGHDNLNQGHIFAERLRHLFEESIFRLDDIQLKLTLSFGLSQRRSYEETFEDIIKKADVALYNAKDNGRNKVEINV
jgi:diguanylate cyclase (GGDEF)-like protein/PAS domain S-box-containing protein